jgi:hypothetical protein
MVNIPPVTLAEHPARAEVAVGFSVIQSWSVSTQLVISTWFPRKTVRMAKIISSQSLNYNTAQISD